MCFLSTISKAACKGRKRNAGDAPKFRTALVPIPMSNTGGGTNIGNCCRLLPAFLFSLVFTVRPTFQEIVSAYKRTENSAAWPLIAITDCSALWLQICHRHICFTRRAPGKAVYLNRTLMRISSLLVFPQPANSIIRIGFGIEGREDFQHQLGAYPKAVTKHQFFVHSRNHIPL